MAEVPKPPLLTSLDFELPVAPGQPGDPSIASVMTPPVVDALREATRAYVAEAIELLGSSVEHRQHDEGGLLEWVRAAPDCFRLQPTTRQWWQRWLQEHRDELHALPQYGALIELLKADSQVAPLLDALVGIGAGSRLAEASYIADRMIWTMAARADIGGFSSEVFDAAYTDWDRELRATHISQFWIAPLMGLSSALSMIELPENMSVGQLSDDNISLLLSVGIQLSAHRQVFSLPLAHVGVVHGVRVVREHQRLVGEGVSMKSAEDDWNRVNGLLADVLIALRIFKLGKVGNSGFAGYFTSWPLRGSNQFGSLADFSPPAQQYGLGYQLTEEDCASFPEFFDACQRAKRCRSVGLAMRRFAYASDRSRAEDQIIDLMIAAEALFLANQNAELSYRLALRAAFFLDPELGPRSVTQRFFSNAYSSRSKIAHGSIPEPKILKAFDGTKCTSMSDFAKELERVMRVALQKAIRYTANAGRFLTDSEWDALILRD